MARTTLMYGSICSGIEAATLAWKHLGWKAAFFSEIDKFPRAVLTHHYPDVPLHGDFTTIQDGDYEPIDILVGGTPCQDFSIAGLRAGFAGDRGNLTFEFVHLAERLHPKWIVWENVPGCLSIDGGVGFGTFLGMLAKLGYGFAYRILDAQYAGLAQRRERVFVVGYLGDWRRAAAVLFERESLRWDSPPCRKAGQKTAGTLGARTEGGGFPGTDEACDGYDVPVANAVGTKWRSAPEDSRDNVVMVHALRAQAQVSHRAERDGGATAELGDEVAGALRSSQGGGDKAHILTTAVRRLTPRECCRLQGPDDDYLDIIYRGKPAADGPKYKALGNSMAVPVMRWIGERIAMVESLVAEGAA